MKKGKIHIFSIPRGKGRLPYNFEIQHRDDGSIQVTRISAYDKTEYHWALKSADQNHWRIIRNGRTVSTVGAFLEGKPARSTDPLSPEQIAYFLIQADDEANLKPQICYD